jgi:hypothetical protein
MQRNEMSQWSVSWRVIVWIQDNQRGGREMALSMIILKSLVFRQQPYVKMIEGRVKIGRQINAKTIKTL